MKKQQPRLIILPFSLIILINSSTAMACGSIEMAEKLYSHKNASITQKVKALKMLTCNVHSDYYTNKNADSIILNMLLDAKKQKKTADHIPKIFNTYRCLQRAKNLANYLELTGELKPKNCPDANQLKRWSVVNTDQLKLHANPDFKSKILYTLPRHYLVEESDKTFGQWVYIKSWGNEKGYVKIYRLKRFTTD